jgi:hypothetical protein
MTSLRVKRSNPEKPHAKARREIVVCAKQITSSCAEPQDAESTDFWINASHQTHGSNE